MSSPTGGGAEEDLYLVSHTHLCSHYNTSPDRFCFSKQTRDQKTTIRCVYSPPTSPSNTNPPVSSPSLPVSLLTVGFIHRLDGWSFTQLQSVSQSVSRTNAPALLASGLRSSAMQQRAHTHAHTQIHKHTHTPPHPSFLSSRIRR